MTEEIIVDGVNVAGCMFLCQNTAGHICCGDDIREDKIPFANFCQENKDCYYKQLKRLEQENERLIETNHELAEEHKTIGQYLYAEIKKYRKENEQLKSYHKALEEIRNYLNTLSSVDSDFTNTETYLRIQDKINEVLK